jgi:hypothetical protein
MNRKKPDSALDMFTAQPATPSIPAKKAKAAPPPSPRMAVAQTCGSIAGIPLACSRAQNDLADIVARCGKALASGVLNEAQGGIVKRMQRQADAALAEVNSIRAAADLLSVHGAIKPVELF